MRRIKQFFVPLVLALVLVLSGAQAVLGQSASTAFEPGKKVSKSTSNAVVKAAKQWVSDLNAGDQAAVTGSTPNGQMAVFGATDPQQALANLKGIMLAPINLLATRNVRQLSDGRFAIDVTYSGFFGAHWLRNDRWVFVAQDGHYMFDESAPGSDLQYVPSKLSKQTVDVTVAADGTVSSSSAKLASTDVTFLHISSQAGQTVVIGLFKKGGKLPLVAVPAGASVDVFQGVYRLDPGTYSLVPILTDGTGQPVPGAKPVKLTVQPPQPTPVAEGNATPVAEPSSPSATPGA